VDPNTVFKTLKTPKNINILKELYKKDDSTLMGVIANPVTFVSPNYTYTNPYAVKVIKIEGFDDPMSDLNDDRAPLPGRKDDPGIDVSILGHRDKVTKEHLFLCLTQRSSTKKTSTKEFQKWYISKEYNTRARAERPLPVIAGRFVFKLSESNTQFELVALAEQAAQEFMPSLPIELYYIDNVRKNRDEGKFFTNDQKSRAQRANLVLLNWEYYFLVRS